jgi:hypothetical protein
MHHFHRRCIDIWLLDNASCPVCKSSAVGWQIFWHWFWVLCSRWRAGHREYLLSWVISGPTVLQEYYHWDGWLILAVTMCHILVILPPFCSTYLVDLTSGSPYSLQLFLNGLPFHIKTILIIFRHVCQISDILYYDSYAKCMYILCVGLYQYCYCSRLLRLYVGFWWHDIAGRVFIQFPSCATVNVCFN